MLSKMGIKLRTASNVEWLVLASLVSILVALLSSFLNNDNTVSTSLVCPTELLNSNPENGIGVYLIGRAPTNSSGTSTSTAFDFVLVNHSNRHVLYRGYRPDSGTPRSPVGVVQPLYSMAIVEFHKWEPVVDGWCGTGAGDMRLKAGQAGRFKAYLYDDERLAKIGVRCYEHGVDGAKKEFVVWSEPFGSEPGGTP